MDYEKLKAHQTVLLDLYTSLSETLKREGDEVDSDLKAMQENIAAEKFLLAIVGEVKAGKSTFVNAILGEAMLPSDDLQATSQIVEIYKSNKIEVGSTFANGRSEVVEEDKAVPFLKEIASINDDSRGIPIVQVSRFLIDHYSEAKGRAVLKEKELENFLNSDLENIYKLDKEEFQGKIREYIKKNISCDKIPQRVSLGYPHDFSEFKHFRVVDTPGINAIGGIEDQTKDFIDEADAVIYLHDASQLESKALRNALEKEIPKRVKDRLILVLTHRSEKFYPGSDEHEKILREAKKLYSEIGSDNIFFVDSLTELHLKEFYGKSTDEIDAIRKEDPQLRSLTASCVEEADGNEYVLLDLLEEQSNFREIRERIERDSIDSASFQMKNFASAMQEVYGVIEKEIKVRIADLREDYRDPQFFASKIQNQKDKMERMKRDYNEFKDRLRVEFSPSDENSRYSQEVNKMMKRLSDRIRKKIFEPNDHNDQKEVKVQHWVRTLHRKFDNEMASFVDTLNVNFQKIEVSYRNVGVQIDYEINVPMTPLDSIWDTASNAVEEKTNKELAEVEKNFRDRVKFVFFRRYTEATESKRDEIRRSFSIYYWDELRPELRELYKGTKTKLSKQISAMINSTCEEYESKLDRELLEQKQDMKKLEEDKMKNEKLGKNISSLEEKEKIINDNIQECIRVGGEL